MSAKSGTHFSQNSRCPEGRVPRCSQHFKNPATGPGNIPRDARHPSNRRLIPEQHSPPHGSRGDPMTGTQHIGTNS